MKAIHTTSFWDYAYKSALKMAKSKLDTNDQFWVEDIVQNALIKAFLQFDKFDNTKGSFINWLLVITKNICFDFSKRKEKNYFVNDDISSFSDEYDLEMDDKFQQELLFINLENCMEQLNEKDKKMIYMKYYKGASSRTISYETNIPEANIPMYMKRAKKKLHDKMLKISA